MTKHFHGFEGSLFDTRKHNWHRRPPLRPIYYRAYRDIENTLQLRATLRHGQYVFPGGYRLAFGTNDGAVLSFDAVLENYREVSDSIRTQCNDGWQVVSCFIVDDCSDSPIYCNHTNELLNPEV